MNNIHPPPLQQPPHDPEKVRTCVCVWEIDKYTQASPSSMTTATDLKVIIREIMRQAKPKLRHYCVNGFMLATMRTD